MFSRPARVRNTSGRGRNPFFPPASPIGICAGRSGAGALPGERPAPVVASRDAPAIELGACVSSMPLANRTDKPLHIVRRTQCNPLSAIEYWSGSAWRAASLLPDLQPFERFSSDLPGSIAVARRAPLSTGAKVFRLHCKRVTPNIGTFCVPKTHVCVVAIRVVRRWCDYQIVPQFC